MARVVSEKIWHSTKISKIEPAAWRPEYPWLLSLAFVDGTFEADPRDIWARAYAYGRPDWTPEKVAQLLDEFERVGLLRRTTDADGRVWGFWVGSDNFQPPPSHRERYKAGKRSLFDASGAHQGGIKEVSSAPPEPVRTPQESVPLGVGVGVGSGVGLGKGSEEVLVCAAKNSENGQPQEQPQKQEQVKSVSFSSSKATPTPQEQPQRQRQVLSPDEYRYQKSGAADATERAVAEYAADIMTRVVCPSCGIRHVKPVKPGDAEPEPCPYKPRATPAGHEDARARLLVKNQGDKNENK